jgi:hypothetical protein
MAGTVGHFSFPVLILILITAPTFAQEKDPKAPPSATSDSPFLDDSHRYITTQADSLAHWMNNFFGDVRTEEEAPTSLIRMRFEQEVDEHNNWVSDLKIRGKVDLPKLDNKVSLLFSDEDSGTTGHDDLLIDSRDTPEDLTLQYNAKDKKKYRVDFRVGLQSSLSPKTSVRYKYEQPFSDSLLGTFSEEALYLGGDGFASITRVELDKLIGDDKIVQWHNRLDWAEDTTGVEWGSSLSWDKRLTEKSAYGYFLAINGRTEPDNMINGHSLGMRYRKNVYRDWLFAEIQPSYRWDKPEAGMPREHGAVILFRLEAVFTRDIYSPPKRPDKVGRE